MNIDRKRLLILLAATIVTFTLRYFGVPGHGILFLSSLIGLMIFYIAQAIETFRSENFSKLTLVLQLSIVLMIFTLSTKYFHWEIGDYPGFLIVPLFVFSFIYYVAIEKQKDVMIIFTSLLFILLLLPMLGFHFRRGPLPFIPEHLYNRYTIDSSVPVKIPYIFVYPETKELRIKGCKLRDAKLFYDAITVYRNAIKIEPKNSALYFDLSECYARINDLEDAILLLDTAILLSPHVAPYYCNRGLLYYKLSQNDKAIQDYKLAINIDSTQSTVYYNAALAYYYKHDYNISCEMLNKAERLGFKSPSDMIIKIKSACNR